MVGREHITMEISESTHFAASSRTFQTFLLPRNLQQKKKDARIGICRNSIISQTPVLYIQFIIYHTQNI